MEGGTRAQRSSSLLGCKGGSQEVDLVPHFSKLNRNELAVKNTSHIQGLFYLPKE